MDDSGPIDLRSLVDLDSLAANGAMHFTFFAFPICTLNEDGVPSNVDAQRYIAAVQSAGVPVGIWLNAPVDGTGYAAVTHDKISHLCRVLDGMTEFPSSYVVELVDKLFREASTGGA